jgi:thiol:disulfide interchange protein
MREKTTIKILVFLILGAMLFVFVQKNIVASPAENEQDKQGIQFLNLSYEEALKTAKKENKLIFLDAYASWCYPCKLMARNTFSDPKVGAYFNEKFINLKMDMEKGEGPELSRKLGVTAYPTVYFISPDGKIIQKSVGYRNPRELLSIAKSIQ